MEFIFAAFILAAAVLPPLQEWLTGIVWLARAAVSAVVDRRLRAKLIEAQQATLDAQAAQADVLAKLADALEARNALLDQVAELKRIRRRP